LRKILKWMAILVSLVIVVGVVLALTGKKTFRTEIVIEAPPSAVWAVLTDAKGYRDWNPVFVNIVGEYRLGSTVKMYVKAPGQKTLEINGKVKTLIPNKELRQSGGMFGFLTFDHQWILEPVANGTKVIQHEVDRGLFMWFWDSSWILLTLPPLFPRF